MKYYDEDGEELVPMSYKDFMAQGKNKTYEYVLNNAPKNRQEKELRDALMTDRAIKIRRELKELDKYLPKEPISNSITDDVLDNDQLEDRVQSKYG